MANKLTDLAVVKNDGAVSLVPTADEMATIMEELKDMDRLPYGRIKIAAGGMNMFQVFDPGEEEATAVPSVEGVILLSHKTNGLWLSAFGGENKAPDCASINGETGTRADTGECVSCADCPYNQFGSGKEGQGRGKACKNMRRVFLMRRGDIFPMVLTLPPTALKAYDNYRTKVLLGRKRLSAVLTRITLKGEKNKDGVAYSAPVFDAVGLLPPEEAQAVAQYAAAFSSSAAHMGVSTDDLTGTESSSSAPVAVEPPEDMPWKEEAPKEKAEQQFVQL